MGYILQNSNRMKKIRVIAYFEEFENEFITHGLASQSCIRSKISWEQHFKLKII